MSLLNPELSHDGRILALCADGVGMLVVDSGTMRVLAEYSPALEGASLAASKPLRSEVPRLS